MFTGIKDLDLKILLELDDRSLLNSCATNKRIYDICNNEPFWKDKYVKRFGETASKYKPSERTWKNHYMSTVIDLDKFFEDPYTFLKYILWSPKGAKYSFFIDDNNYIHPFLSSPEWVMNNFYLLDLGSLTYMGKLYKNITPSKLFELRSQRMNPNKLLSGKNIKRERNIF